MTQVTPGSTMYIPNCGQPDQNNLIQQHLCSIEDRLVRIELRLALLAGENIDD